MPWRKPEKCKDRFFKVLDQSLTKRKWTHVEEVTLISKVNKIGNDWERLAEWLPGRTANAIKTHYLFKILPRLH